VIFIVLTYSFFFSYVFSSVVIKKTTHWLRQWKPKVKLCKMSILDSTCAWENLKKIFFVIGWLFII